MAIQYAIGAAGVAGAVALNVTSEYIIRGIDKLIDFKKEMAEQKKYIDRLLRDGDKIDLRKLETKKMEIELSKEYASADKRDKPNMLKAVDEEIKTLQKKYNYNEDEIAYEQAKGRIIAINNKAKNTALNGEEKSQLNFSQSIVDRINAKKEEAKQTEENAKAEQEAIKCCIAGYNNKKKAQETNIEVSIEARRQEEERIKVATMEFNEEMKMKEDAIKNLAEFDEQMRIASLDGEARKLAELEANYKIQEEKIKALHEAQLLYAEDEETLKAEQWQRELDMAAQFEADKQAIRDEFVAIKAQQDAEIQAKEIEAHAEKMRKEEELKQAKINATVAGLQAIQQITDGYKSYSALYKASAIAEAGVNATQSVLKTMSSVPYPFNIPLAALQGAAAAVQVRKIASAKMYRGGMIPGRNTLIMANEEGREAILNPMAVRAVGGAAGVNALNSGTHNNYSYDNRQNSSTVVINTTLLSQKMLRDEIEPALRWQNRRQ